ncbi:MAG: hypothetical protein FJW38_00155 [Acidobacteria bacterium]|nr:hypothetical protein [Acidobacteriota bacterium]
MTLDEHRKLSVLIEKIGRTDDLSAPPRVEAALLGELRRRRQRSVALRVAAPLALAAVLLIGLLVAPKPTEQTPNTAPIAVAPAPPIPVTEAPPAVLKTRVVRSRRAAPPVRMADTGFLPVGAWQLAEPIERGSIMRVKLPRSAMNDFGIPVSMERWHEQIPADVMLAEDGSVRAVRFISPMQ